MAFITRLFSALLAVIVGLPLLLSSVFQSLTKLGYEERPTEEIAANFLEGHDKFIDEAKADYWKVGYARRVLTPDDIDSHRYFLGGFLKFPAQEATGVVDDLCARAVVLDDNSGRGAVAFAYIDGIGLMSGEIKEIREKLADITGKDGLISINVGSTHAHSGIDTQGLWGNIPKTGRDEGYMDRVVEKVSEAIREAYTNRTEGSLYYSEESHPELFYDNRDPYALDDNFHLFRFVPNDESKKEIYITNFGAHPINLGWSNTEISGDFPYYIEQAINAKGADFIFVQGAIGGGIGNNMDEETGIPTDLTAYEKMKEYSLIVADILSSLAEKGEKVEPVINIRHEQIDFEVNNFVFRLAESAGLCSVKAFKEDGKILLTSEIGYVEIGKNIKVIEAPGEVMPEIVYGGFYSAEEAFNKTEYPYDALNTLFDETDKVLVFGLCNDAVGYIVPDNDYSSSGSEGHYEETVSTGDTAATTYSKEMAELISKWG
ncbi:MAG: hypothetical protein E7555_04020 [Ruminococcaceae bacterium]|nr:hypothetical protein [Oscillospiraceae bacterium]